MPSSWRSQMPIWFQLANVRVAALDDFRNWLIREAA
jgi:hypothetical protein